MAFIYDVLFAPTNFALREGRLLAESALHREGFQDQWLNGRIGVRSQYLVEISRWTSRAQGNRTHTSRSNFRCRTFPLLCTAWIKMAERGGFDPPTPFWGVTA